MTENPLEERLESFIDRLYNTPYEFRLSVITVLDMGHIIVGHSRNRRGYIQGLSCLAAVNPISLVLTFLFPSQQHFLPHPHHTQQTKTNSLLPPIFKMPGIRKYSSLSSRRRIQNIPSSASCYQTTPAPLLRHDGYIPAHAYCPRDLV